MWLFHFVTLPRVCFIGYVKGYGYKEKQYVQKRSFFKAMAIFSFVPSFVLKDICIKFLAASFLFETMRKELHVITT